MTVPDARIPVVDRAAVVTIDGVEVRVAFNDDGEPTVSISTDKADGPTGRQWPHLYVWLNDAELHAPKEEL